MKKTPTPLRPYLFKAFYEWMSENFLTPYIEVNTEAKNIVVPTQFIQNNRIVLNISLQATQNIYMDHEALSFSARFAGVSMDIYIPMSAIIAIFAKETGQGMPFDENEYPEEQIAEEEHSFENTETKELELTSSSSDEQAQPSTAKKSKLRLL